MEVKLLNAFRLQLNTIIQIFALFKLILYSNLLTIINVALYFTFDSIIFLEKNKIKKIKSRPTDPISNHKATGNEHIFVFSPKQSGKFRQTDEQDKTICPRSFDLEA